MNDIDAVPDPPAAPDDSTTTDASAPAAEERADIAEPVSYRWADLDADQAGELWGRLTLWVEWFRRRYPVPPDMAIPPCWFRHSVAVEELTALMVAHDAAYDNGEPGSDLVAWHVMWCWPVLTRLGDLARWGECSHTAADGCVYVPATVLEDVDGLAGFVYDDILQREGNQR